MSPFSAPGIRATTDVVVFYASGTGNEAFHRPCRRLRGGKILPWPT